MMRFGTLLTVGLLFSAALAVETEDRTITKVVKLLQGMIEKSGDDGREDATIFGKFKCYCDSNTAAKTLSIEEETKMIAMMEGKITELQGSSGKLSSEVAQLAQGMTDNEAARSDAAGIREKENTDFKAEEADMTAAVDQMDKALDTLAAVGADQTQSLAAMGTHASKFMEKDAPSQSVHVGKLSEQMQKALKAASVFLSSKQRKTMTGFIQAPFTGEYASQSGEIVGILKNMRDTFSTNLGNARAAEASSLRAHTKYTEVMEAEFATMDDAHAAKTESLGQNDAELGTSTETLATSTSTKAEAEDFLAKLTQLCADKTREYEDRKMVRANEEAAVAQAISILNSDSAFDTFGGTTAAKSGATGFFLQMRKSGVQASVRKQVKHILTTTARKHKSLGLAKLAAEVEGGNPFAMVIKSIKRQMKVIDEEEKADDDKKAFCDDERTKNDEMLQNKVDNIDRLSGLIEGLNDDIENPETGLKAVLAGGQSDLASNKKAQAETTTDRQSTNAEYQQNIANLVEAEKLIAKAHKVLEKFYNWLSAKQGPHHYDQHEGKDSGGATIKRIPEASVEDLEAACSEDPACLGFNTNGILKSSIEEESEWFDYQGSLYVKVYDSALVQKSKKDDPSAPTDEFSETGKESGNKALDMLSFILDETKLEEKTAHETEEKDQADYEDFMTDAKKSEDEQLALIASTELELAGKEKDRTLRKMNLDITEKDKKAIEKYLLSIKSGCDFMDQNLDARKESRRAQKSAMEDSRSLMEDTPEYKSAQAAIEAKELGECAGPCMDEKKGKDHIDCIVCTDKTTVDGYCSANPETKGCP